MTETSQQLTDLMARICTAYLQSVKDIDKCDYEGFGRVGDLRVHAVDDRNGVSIDLYNFEGDGLPVCDGLTFDSVCPSDGLPIRQTAFCISYNPEWEEHPVLVLCDDATVEESDGGFDLTLDYIPDDVQQRIKTWIESKINMSN